MFSTVDEAAAHRTLRSVRVTAEHRGASPVAASVHPLDQCRLSTTPLLRISKNRRACAVTSTRRCPMWHRYEQHRTAGHDGGPALTAVRGVTRSSGTWMRRDQRWHAWNPERSWPSSARPLAWSWLDHDRLCASPYEDSWLAYWFEPRHPTDPVSAAALLRFPVHRLCPRRFQRWDWYPGSSDADLGSSNGSVCRPFNTEGLAVLRFWWKVALAMSAVGLWTRLGMAAFSWLVRIFWRCRTTSVTPTASTRCSCS